MLPDALLQFQLNNSFNVYSILLFCGFFIYSHLSTFITKEKFILSEVYSFIRLLVADNLVNYGKKYLPFIYFLTLTLVFANVGGVALYSFSSTSYIAVTLLLSLIVNYITTKLSLIFQKIYFFNNFMPNGSPRAMGFLLIFIEIISWFSRILSLAIRLFANITAGHILLKILSSFSIIFLFSFSIYLFLIILPNTIITVLVVLESAIAVLQAYVFILLVTLYFASIYGGH